MQLWTTFLCFQPLNPKRRRGEENFPLAPVPRACAPILAPAWRYRNAKKIATIRNVSSLCKYIPFSLLIWTRIPGSVLLNYESGSCSFLQLPFTLIFKDNKLFKSHNIVEIKFFLIFLLREGSGYETGSTSVKNYRDLDPGEQKTSGLLDQDPEH